MSLHTDLTTRPRRRRPPQRGLLFGAPLDRLPHGTAPADPASIPARSFEPVPIALIGASSPVAPARVAAYGAMAASWPLTAQPGGDRSGHPEAADERDGAGSAGTRDRTAAFPRATGGLGPAVVPALGLGVGLGLGLGLGPGPGVGVPDGVGMAAVGNHEGLGHRP